MGGWLGPRARLGGIQPEALFAMWVAVEVMGARGEKCVFTSIADRTHQEKSLHYVGFAFDFSTEVLPNRQEIMDVRHELGERLGQDYDVVINFAEKIIHIEYQPEKGVNL